MSYTLSKDFNDYSDYIQTMLKCTGKDMKSASYPFRDKRLAISHYVGSYLTRLISGLYETKGLPETITQRKHEEKLMLGGWSVIFRHPDNGELYSMFGTVGGERDLENKPSLAIVSHPQLKKSLNLEILDTHFITRPSGVTYDGTCVVARNTSLLIPFYDVIYKYASLMVENDITQLLRVVHARRDAITTAPDEAGKNALETAEKKLEDGEMIIPLVTQFIDEVKNYPQSGTYGEKITDFIEYTQYLKASLFNELGLQANYNMKREAIGSQEAEMNIDSLLTLVEDGLLCRQYDWVLVNKNFGTDISVDFGKLWKNVEKKQEPENTEESTEETSSEEVTREVPEETSEDSVEETAEDSVEETDTEEVKSDEQEETA